MFRVDSEAGGNIISNTPGRPHDDRSGQPSFVCATNPVEFARIQKDILLRVLEVVQSAGAVWAIPVQMTYMNSVEAHCAHLVERPARDAPLTVKSDSYRLSPAALSFHRF
jgi:hypothetical protein